jgi:hypothetical protein
LERFKPRSGRGEGSEYRRGAKEPRFKKRLAAVGEEEEVEWDGVEERKKERRRRERQAIGDAE